MQEESKSASYSSSEMFGMNGSRNISERRQHRSSSSLFAAAGVRRMASMRLEFSIHEHPTRPLQITSAVSRKSSE